MALGDPTSTFQSKKNNLYMVASEVGCVLPMVVVPILPHAEFERNDHREDELQFRWNSVTDPNWPAGYFFMYWIGLEKTCRLEGKK